MLVRRIKTYITVVEGGLLHPLPASRLTAVLAELVDVARGLPGCGGGACGPAREQMREDERRNVSEMGEFAQI